ncbi:MAG: PBP1A family penicillin-binding protein [Candidatus Gastranaerophilales bacterium]|nr:PBP1A family penicillin-binding protein [Candidatus Gastranaerophilales bacterium]
MAEKKKQNNNKNDNKKEWPIVTFIKFCVVTILAITLAAVIMLKMFLSTQPPIKNLQDYKPNQVTQIYSADGELIKTFTAYKFEQVHIKDVPKNLINALVATEDKNFFTHEGYDLFGIVRSTFVNLQAGKTVQGASTITQQLARILFLSNERSYNRKIKEIIIAARIEKSLNKNQILEMYLNNIYLGSGAYGAAGAAAIYFNKPMKDLTLAECALIAGLPQAPSVYSPYNSEKLALKRRGQVLERMLKTKFITKAEYEAAMKEPLKLNDTVAAGARTLNRAPYFVDYVMKELEALGFDEQDISQGGYKITTTLNYKDQKVAEEAVIKDLASWGLTGDKNQAAVFSFSPIDGRILVYVGGKNYAKSQYDRVTQAVRPPGSSFKPFVYATAVYKGWSPNDMIDDTPFSIGTWSPRNYGNKYRGKIPLYKALALSSNVAAVRLIDDTGIKPVIVMARELGITTPLSNDSTISLGSNGVKLFDMVVAYGVFANGGFKVKPYAVTEVETARGKVVYTANKVQKTKVLHFETAGAVNTMLEQVIQAGTGMAAKIGVAQAGKTGTTDDYKDAWFLGYTPNIVTGVWVGNDDNSKLPGLTGGTLPAIIWRDTMKVMTEPYKDAKFDYEPFELKAAAAVPQTEITEKVEEDSAEGENQGQQENPEQKQEGEKPAAPAAPAPQQNKYELLTEPVKLTPAEPDKSYSENLNKDKDKTRTTGSVQQGRFF